MRNKYGYFEYSDVAYNAKNTASYTINTELQNGSALTQLSVGVEPYDFASLEQNSYITTKPKLLYKGRQNLGLLTRVQSDENGYFESPIIITASFPEFFSAMGVTINSRNIIEELEIVIYSNNTELARKSFSATAKEQFYDILIEDANKIVFTISKIKEPLVFFGIFNFEYGSKKTFKDDAVINAEISRHFSLVGDKFEYDTLDLSVIDENEKTYLFQAKQKINYIDKNGFATTYFVSKGEENDNIAVNISAYDWVANLEEEFLGGMYEDYPTRTIYSEILNGNIPNVSVSAGAMASFSGYIPITTKRRALQMIMQGTNIRCFKSRDQAFFDVYNPVLGRTALTEANIVSGYNKTKKPKINSVTVRKHNYSKGTEQIEAYHWYISTTENARIVFSQPLHSLKAYEVIGVDEFGQDIVSQTESANVTFVEKNANYCVVSNRSSNKIVIIGLSYVDSVVEYKKQNEAVNKNSEYENIVVDLTVCADAQKVCDFLYEVYNRSFSITFKTTEELELGGYYNILGENLNIISINNSLNGLYEVEAQ